MKVEDIARICHEGIGAIRATQSDDTQKPWLEAEDWERESSVTQVRFHLDNPNAPASASHDSWFAERKATGWTYGPVRDNEKKINPALVAFDQLPPEQQAKDYLFKGIVHALAQFVE